MITTTTTLNKIKVGQAFQFEQDGPVFVKVRCGFRAGCGGKLHACAPHQPVIAWPGKTA